MHTVCGSSLQWILGRWALLYHCFLSPSPAPLWTCVIKQFYVSKLGRRSDSETNEHILSHNCQAILILLIFVYFSFVFGCAAFTSHHFYCCHFHRFLFLLTFRSKNLLYDDSGAHTQAVYLLLVFCPIIFSPPCLECFWLKIESVGRTGSVKRETAAVGSLPNPN